MIFIALCFSWYLHIIPAYSDNHGMPDVDNEVMHYVVRFGIINIGKAIIQIKNDSVNCRTYIKAEARSIGLLRLVKRIDYLYESCMDPESGLPDKFTISLTDNRNYLFNELVFDRNSRRDSAIIMSYLSGRHVVPWNIHDMLTGFYHFREYYFSDPETFGKDAVITMFFVDELYEQRIRYAGKESIDTEFGETICYKFNPVTIIGNFFKTDEDMSIWFTEDADHIPVKFKLDLTIGSIDGYLVGYQKPE